MPVKFHGENVLILAMADPANIIAIDDVSMMTGYEVRPAVASREDILALISRLTRLDEVVRSASDEEEEQSGPAEVVDLRESAEDAPVIKLVNGVIAQAVEMGASDVHLSPGDGELRVRFRIDGVLQESATVPKRMTAGVISRVKIMGDLDISERRVPQDGRVGLTHRRPPRRPARRHPALACTASRSSCASWTPPAGRRASSTSGWPTRSATSSSTPSARPTAPCS